jgi:Zn-dependent M28 family amino/carboxypeptidase
VLFKLNEKEDNIVILGAHYDTRKIAEKDPDPEKRDQPIPGANDGASGCAVLLELARILYHQKEELNCEIWFLFFDAEDQGSGGMSGWDWCEGSQQFVEDIEIYYDNNSESFDCMILLDMVGGENLQFIWELYSNSLLMEDLFEIGRDLGYKYSFPEDPIRASITDDHKAFSEIGIPTADLIIKFWNQPEEWPYHHTHGDNLTHISKESLKITGTTVEQFLYNNYHPSYSLKYQGNYPWDKNQPTNPLFGIILLIVITGAITGICFIRSRLLHLTKGSY